MRKKKYRVTLVIGILLLSVLIIGILTYFLVFKKKIWPFSTDSQNPNAAIFSLSSLTTTPETDVAFIPTIIESPLITNWGVWHPEEKCSPKNYVVGFQSKVEAECENPFLDKCDNSAMNGISLLCSPELNKIKSGEQIFGNWGWDAQCPSNERVIGFKIKVQPPQWFGDDTATNAIRLKCESGYELISSEERWGDWSDWIYCPQHTYFCGVQTQIQPFQFLGDDTALNNVRFTCCQ